MDSTTLRKTFLDYFAQRGHEVVDSSSLIPGNDPTLLFTNAGMVQFKEVFLGQERRNYTRAASSQHCLRAGGKHNDLDNVGYTARHHTYFEMLGNFSFGDYFKAQSIEYAWDFLTKVLGLPPEKLWVTVYEEDSEAEAIWLQQIKIDPSRFSRCGEKDNFWSMGDTGPCGPCTEIFYDHGADIPGGPPGSPEEDGDRYIEIWNLVFMQYNRDAKGIMSPLPKPSVDTGMGLERIAAVLQGVHNNYDIDLFQHIIKAIAKLVQHPEQGLTSMRVIADHIRSTSFLIADGITPSNEGRGYVLRRIIRRAIRHGHKLGVTEYFFHTLVAPLAEMMGEAYPVLITDQKRIMAVLLREEEQFAKTLDAGMKMLMAAIEDLAKPAEPDGAEKALLSGELVFKLYDTYGFPVDLTKDVARELGYGLDEIALEKFMSAQRERSKAASKFEYDFTADLNVEAETVFTGHHQFSDSGSVVAIYNAEGEAVTSLATDESGIVVLDKTPFYAEGGGQVGDHGVLQCEAGSFLVKDTQKQQRAHLHYGVVTCGQIEIGQSISADVDTSRQATMLNHTATHLLHAALRQIVGDHVIQKGSLVAPDRLRFDYAHHTPLTKADIRALETLVNQQIRANLPAHEALMTPKAAVEKGAMALFGEKYGDQVRVINYGDFSMELCGGTHAESTGEIGYFKIIGDSGIAAGIRRIEALTGGSAMAWSSQNEDLLDEVAELLKTDRVNLLQKASQLMDKHKKLEKALGDQQQGQLGEISDKLVESAQLIAGQQVIAAEVKNIDAKALRDLVDRLKDKLGSGIVLLATIENNKIRLVAGVTKDRCQQFPAGDLMKQVAKQLGGKGGGRPDMAQGGGENITALPAALSQVATWVEQLG